ncbi:MAG: CoA-binding protein [Dehalococcoidia bacterium]|nr:CoA-binding protein [Dehalococcoidia bacterium]
MRYPIKKILSNSKTVAMVGLSANPEHDSQLVAAYLSRHGYTVIPINPNASEIMGWKSYASLRDLPEPPDVVDVFRRAEAVPAIADDAITVGAKALWMQLGIVNTAAANHARAAGLMVVMNHCMKREHERIWGTAHTQPPSIHK